MAFIFKNYGYQLLNSAHSSTSMPRQWVNRRIMILGGVFTSIVLLMLLANHPTVQPYTEGLKSSVPGFGSLHDLKVHPIEKLHSEWTRKFVKKVEGQSRNLQAAVKEYQKRYGRQPPRGFDVWYDYAVEHKYLMIDEFDTLMDSIEPFWTANPQRMRSALEPKKLDGIRSLKQISILNGNASYEEENDHAAFMSKWINKWKDTTLFPDFNFTLSTMDEPRVVAPAPLDSYSEVNKQSEVVDLDKKPRWYDLQHHQTWPELADACYSDGLDKPVQEVFASTSLPFLNMMSSHQDYCHQIGMLDEHGFFSSPTSFVMTKELLPIFSQAAPTRFSDLVYPSMYYMGSIHSKASPNEPDWPSKFNMLYWAGSSTGGYHTVDHWKDVHRARLAWWTSGKTQQPVTLLQQTTKKFVGTIYKPFKSTWDKVSHFFHVKLTITVQCSEEACKEMEKALGPFKPEDKTEAEKYKYVLDIDGNSFSGRFYRLLKSKSAVMKSTIFREWHDDVLMPWVHYIPVSVSANELGEMMRYLATEKKGDEIGKRIADTSAVWADKVLRDVDLEIYFLRMMLEYVRVTSDDRNGGEWDFDLKERGEIHTKNRGPSSI